MIPHLRKRVRLLYHKNLSISKSYIELLRRVENGKPPRSLLLNLDNT